MNTNKSFFKNLSIVNLRMGFLSTRWNYFPVANGQKLQIRSEEFIAKNMEVRMMSMTNFTDSKILYSMLDIADTNSQILA